MTTPNYEQDESLGGKLKAFYQKRKKWLFSAGGLTAILLPKGGFGTILLISTIGTAIVRQCPGPEEKILEHPYSLEAVVDKIVETKDGAKIKAHYYNDKQKKKKDIYFLEADGDSLAYKLHKPEIDSILYTLDVGDTIKLEGYIDRKITHYVTSVKEK